MMNDQQLLRYSRQIMLPDIDLDGQEKLLAAHVLIIGLGGLGSPVSMYLTAAGIGELTLVDFDEVDLSNLQRQIAHTTDRIGDNKAESAARTLKALNPSVNINLVQQRVDAARLIQLASAADVVVDCTDNFMTRFAINAACVATQTPLVSGAAIRMEGQLAVFDSRDENSPCYRCLYEEESDDLTCAANGVIAPLVGIVGSMQALEVMKLVSIPASHSAGRILLFNALTSHWRELRLPRDPHCPVCGKQCDSVA
jgi:molybdopterin/thiamine biosynthesis adenylyltransferase